MSKQDYELIANVINKLTLCDDDRKHVAQEFAAALAKENPMFYRAKFMAWCQR